METSEERTDLAALIARPIRFISRLLAWDRATWARVAPKNTQVYPVLPPGIMFMNVHENFGIEVPGVFIPDTPPPVPPSNCVPQEGGNVHNCPECGTPTNSMYCSNKCVENWMRRE